MRSNGNDIFKEARKRIYQHIELLHLTALSSISKYDSDKSLLHEEIIDYLKRRGYVSAFTKGREPIYIKGFVVVKVHDSYLEFWHDTHDKNKSLFLNDSLLTGLQLTLDYMERM
jgi:hypothetical protein